MEVALAIIIFIAFFILASYLLGSFVQLLSNLTGRRINIRSAGGWTSFKPKNQKDDIQQQLQSLNRLGEIVNLFMSADDELSYLSTGDKEILKEYQLLPGTIRSRVLTAI